MDVLITPEARRELEALRAFRPKPGTWGVLIGHRLGARAIVEKAVPGGGPGSGPDDRLLAGLDVVWPGRTIGLFAVRPGAAFRKAARGPAWYGKVVLELGGAAGAPVMRATAVEFDGAFVLAPIGIAAPAKEGDRE